MRPSKDCNRSILVPSLLLNCSLHKLQVNIQVGFCNWILSANKAFCVQTHFHSDNHYIFYWFSTTLLSELEGFFSSGAYSNRETAEKIVLFALMESSAFHGEGSGTPLQYSCLENPMDGGAWWAAVHVVSESRARLSDFTFTFHFHALEKEMATHASVLVWRIPGTGEPSGLLSMGLHRVGHDWSDLAAAAAAAGLSRIQL